MREKTQSKQVGARARSAALTPEARTRIAAHLHSVIAFMRASSNWQQLIDLMDRAFPKKGDTLPLLLTD